MKNTNLVLETTKIIDKTLAITTIDSKAKEIIRAETLKLQEKFENLILSIEDDEELEDYEKNIDTQLDIFQIGYNNTLHSFHDTNEISIIKGIWIDVFRETRLKNTSSLKVVMLKNAEKILY